MWLRPQEGAHTPRESIPGFQTKYKRYYSSEGKAILAVGTQMLWGWVGTSDALELKGLACQLS